VDKHTIREYLHWLLTTAAPGSYLQSERLQVASKVRPQRIGYASSSVIRKLSALRTLFRIARKQRIVTNDPTTRLSQAKLGKKLPGVLDESEISGLLNGPNQNTTTGLRDYAILELLYGAGLRVSELVGLNLDDINSETRDLLVTGKGNRQRLSPLGKPGLIAVDHYIHYSRPKLQGKQKTYALFLNHHGNRLTQRSIQVMVKHYGIQIGLQGRVHPHTLRHTYATHLLNGGADIRIVQELLGHASPTTTQIYTHLTHSKARQNYMSAHPRAKNAGFQHAEKDTAQEVKN
jgi:site-specific recombinase XerD